jgi:hypothetical protein
MKLSHCSIAGLMGFIAVAALDIALARFAFAANSELLVGAALPLIVLQWAAFSWRRGRGRARAFWLGFLVCGSLITASFVWAMLFPEVMGITRTGALIKTPGSPLYAIWSSYTHIVGKPIVPSLIKWSGNPDSLVSVITLFRMLLWSLPQLVVPLLGGVIAGRLHQWNETGARRPGSQHAGLSTQTA